MQLNPVLSGYFSKLVTLLLTRKKAQLLPYVFNVVEEAAPERKESEDEEEKAENGN